MKFDILLGGESKYLGLIFSELFRKHRVYYNHNILNAINIIESNPVDIVILQLESSVDSFIKDAISMYPDISIFLILEKGQIDETISRMDDILFEYVETPCSWDEIRNKLRLVLEISKLRKRQQRLNIFNMLPPAIIDAIKDLTLDNLYKRVVDYLETAYRYMIPIILESAEEENKFKIRGTGKKGDSILKKIGYNKSLSIELSNTDLGAIVSAKELYMDDSILSLEILNDLYKEGFKRPYIFPLCLKNNIIKGLLVLACSYEEDIEPDDISLWKQLAIKLSFIIDYITTLRDLNKVSKDLKQSQDIIMHQQRLKVLGQMASGISHDLNNIVFPIIGFTELLLEREAGISKQGRKYLYQILGAAEDIRNIVARLRQFYKKREKIENELELININQVTKEIIDLTEAKWKKSSIDRGVNIDIELDLSDNIKEIKGVKSEIRETLINLIFNAVDALVNGGKISISTKMQGDIVRLDIEDTGIGMNKATIEHCLEPFFTTKKEKGTGLGLSIVYGIIQRHGGDIKISSQPGMGTNVTLLLPSALEERKRPQISTKDTKFIRPLKILYIDDELPVTALIRDILTADNHTVFIANDGETGIRLFNEHINAGKPFDIIITDFVMPKLDGGKVASVIKSVSPEIPIILLTGWDLPESRLNKDIDLMLKKPVFPQDLKNAIFKVISKRDHNKRVI